LALDYGLQVQQCLQSGLFTSIKWILCKFRLLRNDQLLDIIFQLVYAYSGFGSAIDLPRRRLLVRVLPGRRSRLRCCTVRNCCWALRALLAQEQAKRADKGAYTDGLHRIRLLRIRPMSIGSRIGRLLLLLWGGLI
jgi:hypothetical protein